uniref:Uncharacterized protein n=1 Tax=Spironucleus salmonicida TaxID=348837 RepID=V6LKN7_9EUKA|eukprot:EST44923.1 Hypothetical protein SS50377_14942 [Spironucleus salmonicida]
MYEDITKTWLDLKCLGQVCLNEVVILLLSSLSVAYQKQISCNRKLIASDQTIKIMRKTPNCKQSLLQNLQQNILKNHRYDYRHKLYINTIQV